MNRRGFLTVATTTAAGGTTAGHAQNYSDYTKDPRPDVKEGTLTAGSADGPVFSGFPVVSGPGADALTILQPLQRHATGYVEYAVGDGPWERADGGEAGLRPFSEHVLKVRLPPLPPGREVRYRVVARTVGWVKVRQFYHGELRVGTVRTSPEYRFRTLDPRSASTNFAVWNDTHENAETLQALHARTDRTKPDFLLWNGDQSNDVHFEKDMAGQFLNPAGLSVAAERPLAYVRGNHDVRGPAARALADFTGTPGDAFYYGFRSGPLAALVLDTGEDKPDANESFGGLAAFERMQRDQAEWLKRTVTERWFRDAPHKVVFCHIPLWFEHPKLPNNRFKGHAFCRALWEPVLVAAGVSLVVSGHTHDSVWMPAKAGQPVAQLVGGAPQPKFATLITGTATDTTLSLKMTDLDGRTLADIRMAAPSR